jgi:MOSC domain-containing protein YiiM
VVKAPRLATEIDQVFVGQIDAFGPRGEPSAIRKSPVAGAVQVTTLGLAGDEQADQRVHGGAEKAIHHFPAEHYDALQRLCPELRLQVGQVGENLSSQGLTEKDLCLGDVFSLGDSVVQVSQGRQPCWKLNVRFQRPDMARIIQQHGVTGWYYRVIREGEVYSGAALQLIERPYPAAGLDAIQHVLHRDPMNLEAIRQLLDIPVLPASWRKTFEKRLATGLKESDTRRLSTPGQHTES